MHRARRFLAILLTAAAWLTPGVAQATVFSFTGGEQSYTVPAGVSSLSITAIGAPGGGPQSGGLAAGRGADVSGVVDVAPGQVLYVEVGGTGGSPAGGFNGGGDSGTRIGLSVFGGGGGSDVRTLPMTAGAISLNSRLIVAAGGGGSGSPAAPGGDAGAAGGSAPGTSVGGGPGNQTAGGAGGCDAVQMGCGMDGSLGVGGTGGSSGDGAQAREGAGGGGGLYGGGGGGGGGGPQGGGVGGGGGGSSLVPSDLGSIGLASFTTAPGVEITPVPPPACQNVTSRTPYGEAVSVQFACTEFASRALTYAIVGAPAHGTLSAVTAAGQVTYTPAAGFQGADSFSYDASSTNGASNIASVSIMVGPPSVAKAGRARPRGAGAEIPVTCDFSGVGVGASCDVTVTMSVTEILRANKLVAVTSAKSRRPKKTRKVVTVGRVSMVIGAGRAQVVDVRLNGRGKRLLSARGKLPVSIVVSQTVGAATQVVSHQRLTLKSGSARHKKPR